MTGPATALSDDQAAVYDRQLRVWGVEVQNRLASAKVLIIGGNGLAAEVAKNIVLAGVGHVGIADSTPCAAAASSGNFLVPADADPSATMADACARTLQGMNPFVEVTTVDCCSSKEGTLAVPAAVLGRYDTVLSTVHGIVGPEAEQLEAACCESGKHLFLSQTIGLCTTVYINLGGRHTYADKAQQQQQQQQQSTQQQSKGAAAQAPAAPLKDMDFPRLHTALAKPVRECLGRRAAAVHPMYQVLRVLRAYQRSHPCPQPQEGQAVLAEMEAIAASLEDQEGAPHNAINRAYLKECAEAMAGHQGAGTLLKCMHGPSAAVVGGVVANAIVKAISKVGAPLRNFFFFSPADGQGVVEDIGGPAPAQT